MKIAIIGTRGIPDFYRGFEKTAQFIALGLAEKGHDVTVYSSHNHAYQEKEWKGIRLIHAYDPEYKLGGIGNFIYDYNCLKLIKNQQFDVLLQFGATSSIWSWLMPKGMLTISNIYSLEWKRSHYGYLASKLLKLAERFAGHYSHSIVSDSHVVMQHFQTNYNKGVEVIPQGVASFKPSRQEILGEFALSPFGYDLYVGSLEPNGSLDMILSGVVAGKAKRPFIVVGNCSTKMGKILTDKYGNYSHIRFLGSIYNSEKLNHLRFYSNLYFYGYAGDGSTHLLLEAMAAHCLISAYNNESNRNILGDNAFYYTNANQVTEQLTANLNKEEVYLEWINRNQQKITEVYNWDVVLRQYLDHINFVQDLNQPLSQPAQTYLYSR